MRKLVGSALLASAVLSTAALATNGDNMIGVSPASRAMGGIGVGMPVGATDAVFRNPAWMSAEKGFKVSFGGILFMPTVKSKANGLFNGAPGVPPGGFTYNETSDAKKFTVPEIAIVNQINDQLSFGIGAFGVSGMGVNYRKAGVESSNTDLTKNPPPTYIRPAKVQPINYTNFQFMKIIPAVSYKVMPGLSVGGGLQLAWGSLDMGQGASQSYGIGAQLGVSYDLGIIQVGATYQTPISMTYKNVYNTPKYSGGNPPTNMSKDSKPEDMKLTQPQEIAFGVGAKPVDNLKVGVDIRLINWKNAKGYKEFRWKNQTVFAVGGEYKLDKLALRAGYNYGKSPLDNYSMGATSQNPVKIPDFTNPFQEAQVVAFNLVGFPAIAEQHITLGAGYQFTDHFTLNVSYVYSPKVKRKMTFGNNTVLETSMSQQSIGVGLDWSF